MIDTIKELIGSNQIFTGLLGAGSITYIGYLFRWIPTSIFKVLKRLTTSSVVINSQDSELYFLFHDWLSKREGMTSLNLHKIESGQHTTVKCTMGYGNYFFRDGTNLVFVHKERIEIGFGTMDQLTVLIAGVSHRNLFNAVFNYIREHYGSDEDLNTFYWDEWWRFGRKTRRSLDTLYLKDGVKEDLLSDFDKFRSSRKLYEVRGVPYRRGYLFTGPPGTGKTTASQCLASHFNMELKILSLGAIETDKELIRAVSGCAANSIILLEDIDCVGEFSKRKSITPQQSSGDKKNTRPVPEGITLSGMLNALDGIRTPEGVIFFMTTNHPENIDPALMRPGRVDKVVEMNYLNKDEACKMVNGMGCTNIEFLDEIEYPISPANLQGFILNNMGV